MKNEKEIIKIETPLYDRVLHIAIGYSDKEIIEYIQKKYHVHLMETPYNKATHFNVDVPGKGYRHNYIWLGFDFNWTIYDQATVAHELLHFVFDVLDGAGVTLNNGSEEAYTYLFEYMFEKAWEKLKKYR